MQLFDWMIVPCRRRHPCRTLLSLRHVPLPPRTASTMSSVTVLPSPVADPTALSSSASASSSASSSSSSSSTSASSALSNDATVIRVGGVPEHFNMAWFMAEEQSLYTLHNVIFEWCEYPLGTGSMITHLKADDCDMIVALCEGLVADIAQSSELRLVGTYVESPLCWAISTGPDSEYNTIADLSSSTIAISRYSSGSHLMSCVLASQRGWDLSQVKFAVEGSFASLRESVVQKRAAAFMWETFTSKPYHDSGEIRRIGDIVTPWPCFLMATHTRVLSNPIKSAALQRLLIAIRESCRRFHAGGDAIAKDVARRYGLKEEDAAKWYAGVKITASANVASSTIDTALRALSDAGVLTLSNYPSPIALESFLAPGFAVLTRDDIRSMRLYNRPELLISLYNNLRIRIGKERGALTVHDLQPFDQNHYDGTRAVDIAMIACGIKEGSGKRVLNIGSSVGGPARYIAHRAPGTSVIAVELQSSLHTAAVELTHRTSLTHAVTHICGDYLIVAPTLAAGSTDAIVSWLTILHFASIQRQSLFRESHRLLSIGGVFYAEDFYDAGGLTDDERLILRDGIYCRELPTLDMYRSELESAGFVVDAVSDLTSEWTAWTAARADKFELTKDDNTRVHGADIVAGLSDFFNKVKTLFAGGHCGGVRIVARKVR